MSYEVLARRLRPTTFDDVVGQPHVTTTLRNALLSQRLPHAILLCGPRGVGKTSIARILARSLNCDQGPTDKPCGACRSCLDIAGSTSMDVQEIDAASHTGVENVREIRESIRFSAAPGKHRIFIIDEVHMLSTAAFNALLKTLEEPPPRSLFIFATTDPQKMPATVLSRVQRFDLRRLPASELLDSLRRIAAAENLEISDKVLRALIREGEGSFRDVLTLLDRLISGLGPQIDDARATEMLGWIDRSHVQAIVDAVLARDPSQSLHALERALEQGVDPSRLASDLLEELRDLLIARLIDDPSGLIDATSEELAALRERAAAHDPETLQRAFRVLLSRIQDLGFAPRPAHALEIAIVRLATLPSAESLSALIEKLDALEGSSPSGPAGGPSNGSPAASGSGATPRGRARAGARSAAQESAPPSSRAPAAPAPVVAAGASDTPAPSSMSASHESVPQASTPNQSAPQESVSHPSAADLHRSVTESATLRAPATSSASHLSAGDLHRSVTESAAPRALATDPVSLHRAATEPETLHLSTSAPSPTQGDPETDDAALPPVEDAFEDPTPPPDMHCPEAAQIDTGASYTDRRRSDAAPTKAAPAPARIDPEKQRLLRLEAKNHPAVLRAIELLDAEIRDIRLPRSS